MKIACDKQGKEKLELVPGNVPKQLIWGSILFNTFVNQGDGKVCTQQVSDHIKLESVVDTAKGHFVIQRDFDRLDKWSDE